MDVLFFWGSPRSYILKTVVYKGEKLEVYKWAHCLRRVTSEQSNTFNSRFTGHECIMFQSTISLQGGDLKNIQHVTNVCFSHPYVLLTLANWLD
jgi:hypothetical protein